MHDFYHHFDGMYFLWLIILIWIFLNPREIPFRTSKKDEPLNILKRRFANGEITKEEYEESKKS
jgi:putative membrane protein